MVNSLKFCRISIHKDFEPDKDPFRVQAFEDAPCEGHLEEVDIVNIPMEIGKVDLILDSSKCTRPRPVKGDKPQGEKSTDTTFQVKKLCKSFEPLLDCQ